MNMKELLLGSVEIAGLFSSAYANDKEVVGDVAMGVSGGDLCNLTINTEDSEPVTRCSQISVLLGGDRLSVI